MNNFETDYYHEITTLSHYSELRRSDEMLEVQKFHQKSIFFFPERNRKNRMDSVTRLFLNEVEFKIPKIDIYETRICLGENNVSNNGSLREFNKSLSLKELSMVLLNSFGIDLKNGHRKFPSGGALFPVYPVFIQLVDGSIPKGIYYYDAVENTLVKILSIDRKIKNKTLLDALSPTGKVSEQVMVYIGDLNKACYKYHYLGYNHLYLETGMLSQSLRENLLQIEGAGDLVYSGFNHNLLMEFLQLSKQDTVITLLQWIGKK